MADRYTLPAPWDGIEVAIYPGVAGPPPGFVWVTTPTDKAYVFAVPYNSLTPVKPALPPEPPIGACVLDREGDVWQHMADPIGGWCGTQPDMATDWEELNSDVYGPLRRLVVDPFGEPVQLPARFDGVEVELDRPGWVRVRITVKNSDGFVMRPERSRDFARAVWAAANQADKAGGS